MKNIGFKVDIEFYNEMIEPVLKERGIIYSDMMIAIVRKLRNQKRLSNYAIDSELFKSENRKQTAIIHNTSVAELFESFRRLFAPDENSNQQRAVKSNIYIRDELYGMFYNYSDDRIIDLAREYGLPSSSIDIDKNKNCVFYLTAEDMEFLKMIKTDYDINRIVQKYVNIINSKSHNVYKDIVSSNGKFECAVNSAKIDVREKHIHHIRLSLGIKAYKELANESHRYFTRTHRLINACLQYVKSNLEDFDDCRTTTRNREKRFINIEMYDDTIRKYNIKSNSEFRDLLMKVDINKLEKYVETNRRDFMPIENINRTQVFFRLQNMSNEDFQRLTKIRKSYSITWVDIIRVALEKDLFKTK